MTELAPRVRCLSTERSLLEFVISAGVDENLPYRVLWEAVVAERKAEQRHFPDYQGFRLQVTERQRELIDAVVDHVEPSINEPDPEMLRDGGDPGCVLLMVSSILEERQRQAQAHPDFATLAHRFLTLPWRRQIIVLEYIGLLRDEDLPMTGMPLFAQSFTRAIERGALRQFKTLVDFQRDFLGLEHRTAAPPDPIPQVLDDR